MRTKRDRKHKADTSHVTSAPQSTMDTKGKRKITEVEASDDALTPQSTADMADVLRQRLVATHEAQRKNRRILKRRTIDLNAINPVLNLVGFFKLDCEIRDQIYQMLWSDTTQIRQRYKRRVYNVTYGDVPFEELELYRRSKFKVPWLLTCKQMLLEGFAEFHQRSVWHFKIVNNLEPNEYIFPLVTPALVREQHLLIAGRSNDYLPWDLATNPFDMYDRLDEGDESSDKVLHIFSLKSSTMAVVNLMTASAEAHETVTRMKIDFHIGEKTFVLNNGARPGRYLEDVFFDLSKLDRLAVHRHLRNLEISVTYRSWSHIKHAKRLEGAFANLMVELDIVGKALVPGGVASQQVPEAGWSARLPDLVTFGFKVEKDRE